MYKHWSINYSASPEQLEYWAVKKLPKPLPRNSAVNAAYQRSLPLPYVWLSVLTTSIYILIHSPPISWLQVFLPTPLQSAITADYRAPFHYSHSPPISRQCYSYSHPPTHKYYQHWCMSRQQTCSLCFSIQCLPHLNRNYMHLALTGYTLSVYSSWYTQSASPCRKAEVWNVTTCQEQFISSMDEAQDRIPNTLTHTTPVQLVSGNRQVWHRDYLIIPKMLCMCLLVTSLVSIGSEGRGERDAWRMYHSCKCGIKK